MHIVGMLITDTCITLSLVTENPDGLILQDYQEHMLEQPAIYQLYVYNPTLIRTLIKNFIDTNKLTNACVVIALESTALREYWDSQDAPAKPGYTMQQQSMFGKTYGAYVRHEQLVSYKLLAFHCFNLLGITTLTTALYYAYKLQEATASCKPELNCIDDVKQYLTSGSSQLTETCMSIYTIGKLLYETA